MHHPSPEPRSAWATCPACGVIRNRSVPCSCWSFREVPPPRWQLWAFWGLVSVAYGLVLSGLSVLLRGLSGLIK
jgi:hypothetical protein